VKIAVNVNLRGAEHNTIASFEYCGVVEAKARIQKNTTTQSGRAAYLAFRDVARQVRNGVCDVVVWHGQDRKLRNGAVRAMNPASSLIDGGQIGVHVAVKQVTIVRCGLCNTCNTTSQSTHPG